MKYIINEHNLFKIINNIFYLIMTYDMKNYKVHKYT